MSAVAVSRAMWSCGLEYASEKPGTRLVVAVSAAAAPAKARVKSRKRIPRRNRHSEPFRLAVYEDQRKSDAESPILRGTRRRSRGRLNGTGRDRTPPYSPGSFAVFRFTITGVSLARGVA
jgi:hypothetical protein